MNKTPTSPLPAPRLCPTCGTRVGEAATRCLVCGTVLARTQRAGRVPRTRRAPAITISAPVALTLVVLLFVGGIAVFFFNGGASFFVRPTGTPTVTSTPPPTFTPTATPTDTPEPTPTPLPPIEYTVKPGDTCLGLAAAFDISMSSIIELNGLGVDCVIFPDQRLIIPRPTPTPTPIPTATLAGAAATQAAIPVAFYTVKEGDTLSTISQDYNVAPETIKTANNMTSDVVFTGQVLSIPLIRVATVGPTPTHTPPPPYDAPVLLLPQDGATFGASDGSVTLQWTGVAELRENEFYEVTVEDVTANAARRHVEYLTANRFIVPEEFRPPAGETHVFRWWVVAVRVVGATVEGETQYSPAGATSARRDFAWSGP